VKLLILAALRGAPRGDILKLVACGLFVMGWSLMWARALQLVPYPPVGFCVLLGAGGLMLIGLADPRRLPAWTRFDRFEPARSAHPAVDASSSKTLTADRDGHPPTPVTNSLPASPGW
jgi:hypothetical protein